MPMITLATPAAPPGVGTVYFQTMTPVAFAAIAATTMTTPLVTVPARRPGVEVKCLGLFRFLPDLSASLRAKRDEAVCALTSSSCIPRSRRRTRRALEKRRFLRSRRQRLRYVLTWKPFFFVKHEKKNCWKPKQWHLTNHNKSKLCNKAIRIGSGNMQLASSAGKHMNTKSRFGLVLLLIGWKIASCARFSNQLQSHEDMFYSSTLCVNTFKVSLTNLLARMTFMDFAIKTCVLFFFYLF